MAEKPQSNGSNAVGSTPVERHSQASQAAALPPSQMSQSGGTRGQLGITVARSLGPGFVSENLGKLMGAFFILLILGVFAYAFAPDSWLGL